MRIHEHLEHASATLIASTKRSGRLLLFGADGVDVSVPTEPAFGIVVREDRVQVSTTAGVDTYVLDHDLTARGEHSAHYVLREQLAHDDVGVHEMVAVGDDVWITAAEVSSLVRPQHGGGVAVQWRLPWVTGVVKHGNRANLNGVAVRDGQVSHVTAFAQSDEDGGWRGERIIGAGVVVDVHTNDVVLDGLTAPHTPRWVRDKLWVCDSGNATVVSWDPKDGKRRVVAELPGFTRGMAQVGHTMVVGVSSTRSTVVNGLKVKAEGTTVCGLYGVNLVNHRVSHLADLDVPEVYDLQVIPTPTAMLSRA